MEENKGYKRLYRGRKGRIITGLCQGLGEYFEVDPVIIRLIALLALFSTMGLAVIVLYFVFTLIVPRKEE
jgi:phage shock protein C